MKVDGRKKTHLKPLDKVRLALLSDRLKTTEKNSEAIVENLSKDIAKILGITESSVSTEMEFSGRELDLVFTINKQNTPKNK